MQDRTQAPAALARSSLVYPVPYVCALGMAWLVLQVDLGRWLAMPPVVRAPALFTLIALFLLAFQLGSDAWYRLADPDGLGRKVHRAGDILEFLAATGPMVMAIVWLVHADELPSSWIGMTLAAALLWYAAFAGLASRFARRDPRVRRY